jgi:hypothetical protein
LPYSKKNSIEVLKARYRLVRDAGLASTPAARLPEHYKMESCHCRSACDRCQAPLRRQRTSIHYPVGLLLGQPRVRSVQMQCPICGRIYNSEAYSELVPPHGNYAFDLIVEVGLSRFLRHRQNAEIRNEIDERWGLQLPCSTISELAQSFLDYLSAVHQAHIPELRAHLQQAGGYALHVDGTCEAGTDIIFNAVAGNCGWTLAGCKMAAEDATQIESLLRLCMESFGNPLSLVRDLSSQIEAAHQRAMPGILDLICHYHFLLNVGVKLCDKPHTKLNACLRRLKIRPALCSMRHDLVRYSKQRVSLTPSQIEQLLSTPEQVEGIDPVQERRALAYMLLSWLEDYESDLHGEYFPFDLPCLALFRRYRLAYNWLVQMIPTTDSPNQSLSSLKTIMRHLAVVVEDKELVATAERLEKSAALLDELREALRLKRNDQRPVLRQRVMADEPALSVLHREELFRKWGDGLDARLAAESDSDRIADLTIVLDYLRKYRSKLISHVIYPNGHSQPFIVQRTNNISEHRFGRTKQGLRRKLGIKNLARHIQAMRPEEFLVSNLNDPDYLKIICGGSLENLASSFAQSRQAGQAIRLIRRQKKINHPIPLKKKSLREEGFLSKLKRTFKSLAKQTAA